MAKVQEIIIVNIKMLILKNEDFIIIPPSLKCLLSLNVITDGHLAVDL